MKRQQADFIKAEATSSGGPYMGRGWILINEHGIRFTWDGEDHFDLAAEQIRSIRLGQYTTGSPLAVLVFGLLGLAAKVQVGQMFVTMVDGRTVAFDVRGFSSSMLAGALSSYGYHLASTTQER